MDTRLLSRVNSLVVFEDFWRVPPSRKEDSRTKKGGISSWKMNPSASFAEQIEAASSGLQTDAQTLDWPRSSRMVY